MEGIFGRKKGSTPLVGFFFSIFKFGRGVSEFFRFTHGKILKKKNSD